MIDDIDRAILRTLAADSRTPLRAIAEAAGLSSPAAAERMRKLEDRGVIQRYSLDVHPAPLGYGLQAIVRIRPLPGKLKEVEKLIAAAPEVAECDKVTGEDCYVARIHLRSIAQLDTILSRIADNAETNSAIVKSQVVARRPPPLVLDSAEAGRGTSRNRALK